MMGCLMDNLSMEETGARVASFVRCGKPHQHVVFNVDKLVKASRDAGLRRIINECALISVDGMPVVWAARVRQGSPAWKTITVATSDCVGSYWSDSAATVRVVRLVFCAVNAALVFFLPAAWAGVTFR